MSKFLLYLWKAKWSPVDFTWPVSVNLNAGIWLTLSADRVNFVITTCPKSILWNFEIDIRTLRFDELWILNRDEMPALRFFREWQIMVPNRNFRLIKVISPLSLIPVIKPFRFSWCSSSVIEKKKNESTVLEIKRHLIFRIKSRLF